MNFEMSYGESDIPNYFYLCCNLTEDLIKGRLNNLKGISSTPNIAIWFWKQCFLEMPARKLLELNKLSRVMYYNPNYMASKNFSILNRISNLPANAQHLDLRLFLNWVHPELNLPDEQFNQLHRELENMKFNHNNLNGYIKSIYQFLNSRGIKVKPNHTTETFFTKYFKDKTRHSVEQEWLVKPEYARIEAILEQKAQGGLVPANEAMEADVTG
jgi:hypothetical protein